MRVTVSVKLLWRSPIGYDVFPECRAMGFSRVLDLPFLPVVGMDLNFAPPEDGDPLQVTITSVGWYEAQGGDPEELIVDVKAVDMGQPDNLIEDLAWMEGQGFTREDNVPDAVARRLAAGNN